MNTMTTAIFDTLIFANKLKAAGFNEKQAEAQAEALADVFENNVATKQDLKELEARVDYRFNDLEQRFKHEMESLGYKLTIRLGGMLIIGIGALTALMKL